MSSDQKRYPGSLEDLLAYAQNMRAQQASALERLADNARELGLEY